MEVEEVVELEGEGAIRMRRIGPTGQYDVSRTAGGGDAAEGGLEEGGVELGEDGRYRVRAGRAVKMELWTSRREGLDRDEDEEEAETEEGGEEGARQTRAT